MKRWMFAAAMLCLASADGADKADPAAEKKTRDEIVRANREAWSAMTKGNNLAQGIRVRLIPKPNYRLTTGPGDETDLTDGKLSSKKDDRIWFNRDSVGYYNGGDRALLVLDLGSVKPVDRVAVRALGGSAKGFKYPSSFEVLVSKDGKLWHSAVIQTKLQPAEAGQADFRTTFYYPEETPWPEAVVKSFLLPVHADARYLAVRVKMDQHFFSDEIAVIEAEKKDADYNRVYQSAGMVVPLDGISVHPRVPELAVVAGIAAPQKFEIDDLREKNVPVKKAVIRLELPEGLSVSGLEGKPFRKDGNAYNRFTIPLDKKLKMKVIYILSSENLPGNLPDAGLYAEYDGRTGPRCVLPVKTVKLAPFETFRKLPVCLAWMPGESVLHTWPDFLKNYRRFGFNEVGVFPRFLFRSKNPDLASRKKDYQELSAAGFRLVMNDSTFHEMMVGKPAGHEIFCQMDKPCRLVCPSYTGGHYRKEMDRVARCVALCKPRSVGLDIECFNHIKQAVRKCKRCREAIAASGKSAEEYMRDCGTRQIKDIYEAVAKGAKEAGIPVPKLYFYGLQSRHGLVTFSEVYPKYLSAAQPSLYVGGHPEVVHEVIRTNYRKIGKRDIIPWLSPGCYGEFDSRLVEPIVLEAFLNGAGGIWYYCFGDFADSPLDFWYHARAVAKLAPFEDLLIRGKYGQIAGSNPKMFYSSVSDEKEALILIGNYYRADPETTVELPFGTAGSVRDLDTGKTLPASKKLTLNVPPGGFRLLHVTAE